VQFPASHDRNGPYLRQCLAGSLSEPRASGRWLRTRREPPPLEVSGAAAGRKSMIRQA